MKSSQITLALAISLASVGVQAAITEPDVLHRFTVEMSMDGTGENLGAKPHLPPIYEATTGKLYGVTPTGGTMGVYSVNYSFTPNAETIDYKGVTNSLNMVTGFYTGLISDSDGVIYGGANPLELPFPLPLPTAPSGLIFKWDDAGLNNAIPGVDTDALFQDNFDIRGMFAMDSQNNLYFGGGSGRVGMSLFRKTAAGELEQLVNFALLEYVQGDGPSAIYLKGQYPAALIYSEADQAIYGLAVQTQSGGAGDPAAIPQGDEAVGTLFKVSVADFKADGTSNITLLHTFSKEAEGAVLGSDSGQHALIETGDFIYGTTDKAVWRIKKDSPESFGLVHKFGSGETVASDVDGGQPHGPLVLAKDGNIYGTTLTSFEKNSPTNAGTLYQIKLGDLKDAADDQYQQLYQFNVESDGAWPVGLNSGPSANGLHTLYGASRFGGEEGNVVKASGAEGLGTVYSIQVQIPGSIELITNQTSIELGEAVTLNWTGTYLASCEGVNDWPNTQAVEATTGEATITPDQSATYTYSLNCLDVHGAQVNANVDVEVTEPAEPTNPDTPDDGKASESSSSSSGGAFGFWSLLLMTFGGLAFRRRPTK